MQNPAVVTKWKNADMLEKFLAELDPTEMLHSVKDKPVDLLLIGYVFMLNI